MLPKCLRLLLLLELWCFWLVRVHSLTLLLELDLELLLKAAKKQGTLAPLVLINFFEFSGLSVL